MEYSYWNFLRAKILPQNSYAYRYEKDIKVQLKGNFTHLDSLYIKKNIQEIGLLLKTVNIQLVDSLGNLTLTLVNSKDSGETLIHNFYGLRTKGTIRSQEYKFALGSLMSQEERNTYFRYYLVKSLSEKQHNPRGNSEIACSVFQEEDPMKSEITEVDKFIIRKLYSPDFYDQFKANFHGSLMDYYNYRFGDNIKFISNTLGLVLGFILLLLLLKFRIISTETTNWWSYIKQGFLTIHCILIFYLLSQSFATYSWLTLFMCFKIINATELLLLVLLSSLHFIENIVSNKKITIRLIAQTITTPLFIYLFFISYKYIFAQVVTGRFKYIWSWEVEFEQIIIIISAVCIRLIFNFVNFKNIQEIRVRDIELSQLKLLKTKAELQALHSRINPHFLYNSLNSIAALAYINPSKTEQMALALSDFFRYAINHKDQDMIEVDKEVDIARTYLQIEKARFGDDLEFTIEIDNSIQTTLIPRFLIQPLIENAVKHGVSVIQEKGIIKLEISKKEEHLFVKVFDNGPDFPDMPISGYGLQSLYEKLELLYGESAKISWANQPNKNICIRLPFTPKSV